MSFVLSVIAAVAVPGAAAIAPPRSGHPVDATVGEALPQPPPVAPVVMRENPTDAVDRVIFSVGVEANGNGEKLWSGQLRLSNGGNAANYQSTLNEVSTTCPQTTRAGMTQRQFRINLMAMYAQKGERLRVSLAWVRPGSGCEYDSSTVALERTISLPPGATVEVTGDAGLSVKLTRPR